MEASLWNFKIYMRVITVAGGARKNEPKARPWQGREWCGGGRRDGAVRRGGWEAEMEV